MGKSTGCLRIITCGGGSIIEANEAGQMDQAKRSKEKKGWSFKKKSSTSRAVTNSLITETQSLEHPENVQSAVNESLVSEKESTLPRIEKSLLPQQVAVDSPEPDTVIVNETEKQLTTAAANSYVADELSSPHTCKKSDTAIENSNVADDVPAPETEKNHSDAVNLRAPDGLTVPKTEEYEAVLTAHESDAQKELKSVIKLQAMVRGHLVRSHAIGALRCVQAIAKMQVLVRARYARTRKDRINPKSKPEVTYTSMTDLLKNSFARQLLESSPKSKPMKIKCDPLSRDSSWVWLERWMSLASPGAIDELNAGNDMVQEVQNIDKEREETAIYNEQEEKITVDDYLFNEENEIFFDAKDRNLSLTREDSKFGVAADQKVTNSDRSDEDLHSASLVESQKTDILEEVETVEAATEKSSVHHTASEYLQPEIYSVDESLESKTEQALELETGVTELGNKVLEELETEMRDEEIVKLQTEAENIIAESQHEPVDLLVTQSELVSAPVSANISDSVLQDPGVDELVSDTHLSAVYRDSNPIEGETEEGHRSLHVANSTMDHINASDNEETKEVIPHSSEFVLNEETAASSEDDIVINHNETAQVDHQSIKVSESDCSTELSITSTLDSPDRLETERVKVESEKEVPGDVKPDESKSFAAADEIETESVSVEKGKSEFVNGESAVYAATDDMGKVEKHLETYVSALDFLTEAAEAKDSKTDVSDVQVESEGDAEISHQASPGSQVTVTESQGTPSSQVSVSTKSKIIKSGKSGSIKKRTILSAAKKSPVTISNEKNSLEKQSKEHNSAKRRTSFGSPKPEVSDQEQRRGSSSTSSSLPSYMQATESARAKANAAGQSPHSSPDVTDNDVFLRKRHSLSSGKDKQDSPRLRRTSSQANSGSKSNGTSPIDRKWKR